MPHADPPPASLPPTDCLPPTQLGGARADLRDLCGLMSGQMDRLRSLLEYAGKGTAAMADKARRRGV